MLSSRFSPLKFCWRFGAHAEDLTARLELDPEDCLEAKVYSVVVTPQGREGVTLAITFDGAEQVCGAKFLEDLGLNVDSESGRLEPARHHGFAYNCEP
jgi:predicted aspartyl protease